MIGQTVAGFRIDGELGSGGMGAVYKAYDVKIGRPVSLKIQPSHRHAGITQRFIDTTRHIATLYHPNIAPIYGFGKTDDGKIYVATAYHGETLQQKLAGGRLPLEVALNYFRQIVEGLAEAHRQGYTHHHLKPSNVMITQEEIARIVDFGMIQTAPILTKIGTGQTVAYMSPEQLRDLSVDQRADLWAAGAMLYEMLTGRQPFHGDNVGAVVTSIITDDPTRVTMLHPTIPGALEEIVVKALTKDPSKRYRHTGEMLDDLKKVQDTLRPPGVSLPPPTEEPREGAGETPEPTRLGASAPQTARPGDGFTARFVAYTPEEEEDVEAMLKKLSPRSETHLSLKTCRWKRGTHITVRLAGRHLEIDEPEQTFVWQGKQELLDFDVYVPEDAPLRNTVLKFDVLIDTFRVAKLRLDLTITAEPMDAVRATITGEPAYNAFASYSSKDQLRVSDMIAVLLRSGMHVFWDKASLRAGERWEPRLRKAIRNSDAFYLFWSLHAKASEWVEREWRMALAEKGLDAIEPQPLVPPEVAPYPEELKALHFDDPNVRIRDSLERHQPPS